MNTIDAILYINLDFRLDRKKHIESEIARIGFPRSIVYRVQAIYEPACGHLGCCLSHIKALELAVKHKWKRVLILEDDFKFQISPSQLKLILKEAEAVPWDVLLLAKGHSRVETPVGCMLKVNYCTTTSGYIVKAPYYETLLNNFRGSAEATRKQMTLHAEQCLAENKPISKLIHGVAAIDQTWIALQKKDAFYITDPVIGKQHPFSSDTF
jgi:GR25 family glycosyltransferase involved in LPS biosynthesis